MPYPKKMLSHITPIIKTKVSNNKEYCLATFESPITPITPYQCCLATFELPITPITPYQWCAILIPQDDNYPNASKNNVA